MNRAGAVWLTLACGTAACNTAGSAWMAQPLDGELSDAPLTLEAERAEPRAAGGQGRATHVISEERPAASDAGSEARGYAQGGASTAATGGRVLGTFKNTYYDFPRERDFDGAPVSMMDASCKPLASVPRGFYESVCVQGSGILATGGTVSFAKRDCACAAECPRTGQRICFDLLDRRLFPWGRGATGRGITPLFSVAVDSTLIPLGTALYIPEYDGVVRDLSGNTKHDGCFVAEDRGLAVKGEHVDVFTGDREITRLWNRLVPSSQGVTVVVDSPRCAAASKRDGGGRR